MAIDRDRLKRYLDGLVSIQKTTDPSEFIDAFERRFEELLLRKVITPDQIPLISQQLQELFGQEFAAWEQNVLSAYDGVLDLVNKEYDDIGPDLVRRTRQLRAIESANRLQMDSYEQSTIDAVKEAVSKGIKEGKTYYELVAELKEIGGKAKQYAETLASTHLKRYSRNIKMQKALIAGVQIFLYAGVLRDTTRAFCRACLNQYFHIDDIRKMKNGNLEPVEENCGGWNCIHEWEPDPLATEADIVKGKLISAANGSKIIDDGRLGKVLKFAQNLDRFGSRRAIQVYIDKSRIFNITDENYSHIKEHYPDFSKDQITEKINKIKNNPTRIYYQYNNGPRILFEKDGDYLFTSAGKVRTMFTPEDVEKYHDNFIQYLVELRGYK